LLQRDVNFGRQNPPKSTLLCIGTEKGARKPEAPKRSEVCDGNQVKDWAFFGIMIAMVEEIELDDGTCQRVIASKKIQSRNPTTTIIKHNNLIQERSEYG
jgi:hypothetical protein